VKQQVSRIALIAAYDSGSPGWKKDGDSLVLDGSGNPIYIDASGREMSVVHDTITRLGNEARDHRTRAEAAEGKLKTFEGIDDPAKAKAALDTVSRLDQKQLIDAGKVDEVKQQITQQYETRLSEVQKSLDTANDRYNRTLLDGAFKSSEFIKDNLAVPADLIQAAFRDRFKVDGDNIVPLDNNGNPLQSPKRIGETAGFEEALSLWIEQRPDRDVLLKAPEARGSGNNGGGGNRGQGRIIKRADFDAMTDPAQKADLAAKMGSGEVKIVD
jgi:hypothetical protein